MTLNTHCWRQCKLSQPQWMSVQKGLKKLVISLPHQLGLTCLCHLKSWQSDSTEELPH